MSSDKYSEALKQAALGIQRLKEKLEPLERAEQARGEPIAIVGMGCRFPGSASSPAAFWELLDAGRDGIRTLDDRWRLIGATPAGDVPRWAGLLAEPIDEFDAAFFGISPREAHSLDPQQRLLLEVGWEAMEDAGIVPASLLGSRTGVFIGAIHTDYADIVKRQPAELRDAYAGIGNMLSIAAGRLAYTWGFRGPCLTVDTACSASLVAVHLACRSLRSRESDLALAGGVELLLSEKTMEIAASLQALAPDGRCKTFDALANGFARGEGCGLVVLKRLADARRDGDRIWALIRGSAINQDGRSAGLTAPNALAQVELLREALKDAKADPADIGFVEAHGTGTALGDPIEVEALRTVVGAPRPDGSTCVLGAVKTNIGHLESVAGVAGLIKVALSLHHECIPRNLNLRTRNPRLRLENTALSLATQPVLWPRGARRRLAGVSSFGLSGTNAHVVLEEAPQASAAPQTADRRAELFVLSARNESALQAAARQLAQELAAHPEVRLRDLAFSLATMRSHHEQRLAVVASSPSQLRELLNAAAQGQTPAGVLRGTTAAGGGKLAFLFAGQGAQRLGMGRGLSTDWPAFRTAFAQCAERFDAGLPRPLIDVVWAEAGSEAAALLDQTLYTQPALFALEYALCALWADWGIRPELLLGHSIGELAAACVAGIFPLHDAVKLVAARSKLMQALPSGGAMVTIGAAEVDVAAAVRPLADRVSIAAVNGADQVVIAGEDGDVATIAAGFAARGMKTQALRVSHAFHSPRMEPMLSALRNVASTIDYGAPTLPIASNLTGKLVSGRELSSPDYWVRQVRGAVRFGDGVRTLQEAGAARYLEIGPRATLLGLLGTALAGKETPLLASLRGGKEETAAALEALGALYTQGENIAWDRVFAPGGRRVALPTYPWQRQRYFIDAKPAPHRKPADAAISDWFYRLDWPEMPRTDSAPPQPGSQHWLVVSDAGGVGDALATTLRSGGHSCTLVPSNADVADIAELLARPIDWQGVLYLRGLDAVLSEAAGSHAVGEATQRIAAPLLQLLQGLVAGSRSRPPRLWIVTRGACAVGQERETAPCQAALWGLGRVAANEHPALFGGLMDLDPDPTSDDIAALVSELVAPDGQEELALRKGRRHAARLSSAPPDGPMQKVRLSAEASYLITGGLGTLGLQVAQWLVQHGARHLVLSGRRGHDSPGVAAALASLAEQGAEVRAVAADVTDVAAMRTLLASITPPLRGVFHAAGALEDKLLVFCDAAALSRVLRPKVDGAWILHTLTREQPLDLFVLFSSFTAVAGIVGQAAYAAGNAFLDALAGWRRAQGLPALSIGWGLWSVGMGTQAQRSAAEALGVLALPSESALTALGFLLGTSETHRIVAGLDWQRITASLSGGRRRRFERLEPAQAGAKTTKARGIRGLAPAAARALLPGLVREIVAEALGHVDPHALDADRGFADQGLDSLMAVQIRNRLQENLDQQLAATLAFDYPTLNRLVDHLLANGLEPSEQLPQTPASAARSDEPIAIIGVACRFPGGIEDLEGYWRLLAAAGVAVSDVPPERWNVADWYDENHDAPGRTYVRRGGFLRDLKGFDATFFRISPREAVSLDPQQRLLLEVGWEALENAGQSPAALRESRTGVFIGAGANEYAELAEQADESSDSYRVTGNAASFTAGRISFVLGLHGPSLAVDTACSSSLVALHLSCQSLRQGECERALVGGVNVLLSPQGFVKLSRMRALSSDGRCKTFSAEADGYGRAEGCAMLVLERLSDAQRNGRRILAVIRGTAINHDGPSSGITVPSGPAQQAVLRQALTQAGVAPEQVDFVECHGTGTALGDPIEVQALGAVFGPRRPADAPLVIGAVKANLGHLEPAAGLAGVLKIVAALQHEQIPAQPEIAALNPHVLWDELPVKVPNEAVPWVRGPRPRIAGVSAFGLSGTNAHAVLEEAPLFAGEPAAPARSAELVVLSGKNAAALSAVAQRLREHVMAHPDLGIGDIACSLATTRSHLEHRLALAASSREALLASLAEAAQGRTPPGAARAVEASGDKPKVVFVFPGQGGQWLGMGRQLLSEEPVFRASIESSDRAIFAETGWSLLAELAAEPATSRLGAIEVVQPMLFAIEVALAALWRSWGIEPDAVVGHSMGEAAAAYVAGALSLQDAATVICRRSQIMRRISGKGEMALVELSLADAESAIAGYEDQLSVAVSNGLRSTVLSGDPTALGKVLALLEAREVFCRRVKVDVASHSPQVDPLRDDILAALAQLTPRTAALRMFSTVTGEAIVGPELDAGYFMDNLRQPVRFAQAVQALLAEGHALYIEMSPHPVLTPAIEEMQQAAGRAGAAVGSTRREQPERAALLESLAVLYATGYKLTWARLFPHGGRRVPLPTYPWQHETHWIDVAAGVRPTWHRGEHALLGEGHYLSTQVGARLWNAQLHLERLPWLLQHRMQGASVWPIAGHLELALAAGSDALGEAEVVVSNLSFAAPLSLDGEGAKTLQIVTTEETPERLSLQLTSPTPGGGGRSFTVLARGQIGRAQAHDAPALFDLQGARSRLGPPRGGNEVYAALAAAGLECGPAFRGLVELWPGDGEALGRLRLPSAAGSATGYRFHPALLDACLQVLAGALGRDNQSVYVPAELGSLRLWQRPPAEIFCHARLQSAAGADSRRTADLRIVDGKGALIAELSGLLLQELTPSSGDGNGLRSRLATADTSERAELLRELVCGAVSRVLRLPASRLDEQASLVSLGMDSLMGLELQHRLMRETGVRVAMTQLLRGANLTQIVSVLLEQLPAIPAVDGRQTTTWLDAEL